MIIVGVDPGKITGISVWWHPDFYASEGKLSPLDTAEVEAASTVAVIRRMLDGQRPTLVAVERFTRAPGRVLSSQPDADRVIGAVRSLCDESTVRCVYQSPGPAKKIAPKSLLNAIGYRVPTPDDHADNATQHVLLCLATFYPETFAKIVGV